MIAPFRGAVYNDAELESHGGLLLSPPYDVLSPARREEYLDGHAHNFVHLDLGRVLPGEEDPLAWHARSASTLSSWLAGGVLVRRERPSIVLMDTEWRHPVTGRRLTRHGIMCLMRLEEAAKEARVRLHEKTFSFHKEERLHLMEKTGAQLSPVFGFFPDADDSVLKTLYDLGGNPDLVLSEPSGLCHNVSFLQTNSDLAQLIGSLSQTTVYIADGHHRYETALRYRSEILSELARNGQEPAPNSAIDYVLVYLCPMGDPGLCVLPTHRVLASCPLSDAEIIAALEPFAEIKAFPRPRDAQGDPALSELERKMARDDAKGLTVFGLHLKDSDAYYFVKIREKVKQRLVKAKPEEACLSVLDVSVLTNVVFKEALGLTEADLDDPRSVSYFSSVAEAVGAVDEGGLRAAFIVNPTSLGEILKVTEGGMVMPRKATYFYPKVSNGVVFNLVDPMESIPDVLGALAGAAAPVSDF
jgi:uncharacterized protein (DUF1015 family)